VAQKRNWLVNMFKPRAKKQKTFNESVTMVGYEANFTSFGDKVLYSDIVLSALRMKARFFGKLEPRHIRNEGGKVTVMDSAISKVLRNPNSYQTTFDFLTQALFMQEMMDACYIYPDYYVTNADEKRYTAMYILLPSERPRTIEDEDGKLKLCFTFDGYSDEVVFDYDEIIVWKQNCEDEQYRGGGKYGKQADLDLLNSLEAYHQIKQSIAEASKIGCTFDGIVKINAYGGDLEKNKAIRDKFIEDLRTNKGGVGVLDNGSDYVPIQRQLKMVDSATLKEIKENIIIHTGVSVEMLMGKFNSQEKEAFYENWIEPKAISLGQAMSKVFFSQWQTTHGDQIVLYPHKVQLMATSEIVSIIQTTISAGVFTLDEYREMLGYAPLPNGEGEQRPRGFNNLDGGTKTPKETTEEIQ
jgi:HK97 family phage portal protein